MTVFRSRLIINTAAVALALIPRLATAQMDTSFSNFVTHAPVLPAPVVSTDILAVVRGGHSYQFPVSPFSITPTFETLTVASAPGTFSLVPANQTFAAFNFQTTATGTVSSTPTDTGAMALMWLKQDGALVGMGIDHQIALFEADYVDRTTVQNNDTYNAVIGNCNMPTPKGGGGAPGTSCVGVTAAARAWAPQGGTPGSESGGVHGLNIVSGLSDFGTTPTNYNNAIGAEADLIGCTGCTLKVRWGWGAIDFGDGFNGGTAIEHGSSIDAAFVIGSLAGPTNGWVYGMDFAGQPIYAGNPLTATGTVLGSSSTTPIVAGQGINLSNFIISGNAYSAPDNAWFVTGAGNETAASVTTQDVVIGGLLAANAFAHFSTAGVEKWEIGREAATGDFVIINQASALGALRVASGTDVLSLGSTNAVSINTTGGVTAPGLSTSLGSLAGSICATAAGVVLYKTGANCF